jgi:hypothetical protein
MVPSVLVLNAGSSSIKFPSFAIEDGAPLGHGITFLIARANRPMTGLLEHCGALDSVGGRPLDFCTVGRLFHPCLR